MEEDKVYIVKGKHWVMYGEKIEMLCPNDMTPVRKVDNPMKFALDSSSDVMCPDCDFEYHFDLPFATAKQDVARMMLAKKFQKLEIIDIDGINTPVLKKKVSTKDDKYFASVQINESKRGPQLVIYAGKKGSKEKAQVFVTPETKKMSFDHKDVKPTDIFTKITAEFIDGSVNEIKRGDA
ncbi:MAG: hypothetical protein WAW63_05945 [Candidatus Saccharimonadales bacterium]|jgi:hypothetical protein|nr:hypothetical protein [Candidatus Saccharibacteria bacterium]